MASFANDSNNFMKKFQELQKESIDEQCSMFTRRFVFKLNDQYKDVIKLAKEFKAACENDESGGGTCLSHAGAANFMQAHGKTRTAYQRKAELADIDMNKDGRISFIEYLLLHYKVIILDDYFKRNEMEPNVDMTNDGVGLTGVGDKLIEELFAIPQGLDKNLEQMMKEFSVEYAKRQKKITLLQLKVQKGGVQGMAAKNELEQLLQQDTTEMNAVEARIAAAVKKAVKKSEQEIEAKNKDQEQKEQEKVANGRSKLAEKMAKFNKRVSQRLSFRGKAST